jgi:hypothetical protein
MDNFFPDAWQQMQLADHSPYPLDANDWKRCIQDDCASWELSCLVHTNQRSHDAVFPRPILIRVEYAGQSDSFDGDRWRGLLETIERDFESANYESEQVSFNGVGGGRAWKQWVITPRSPLIGVPPAR